MAAELTSRTDGQTLVLTLSHPGRLNTLSPDIYAAGIEALNGAERSADVRSVVLTGADGLFCAGGDLARLQANRQQPPAVQAASIDALHDWIETIRTYPKPVVAAIEGAAAGAGFSLVLACDFAVAARSARFSLAYSRVGLSPDGGASWALAQAVPRALAAEWLMLGEAISAERLHALGVINRLTEPGAALAGALNLCASLHARAPNVLASVKELLVDAAGSDLHAQLARERRHFVDNLHHENAGEGIVAFFEKREPLFR
ncbi:oxepin-CoA hydrolase, alternative type [Simplicispira suum]|uniref:Enoyl-CoA hydratase n=1 Tax=Simplicispira suum TaxID=2109915 RepID=A0A2S0MW29_9BURK|nr:enoyl-CoA hydratase [Simplicispira suum]AVO40088.1 enoyl-CoA hydratase [Simplicispira suum]MBW7834331.1 enoyl-CoA hydratase/isomerase family protein [Simplicispira suum]